MDPPRHDELRAILARALTPARVAALEPRIRAIAGELVDAFAGKGRFDAAADFACRIPTLTMCALLDLPTSERARFLRWNLDTLAGSDFTSEAALRAYGEMEQLLARARRRAAQAPGSRPDLAAAARRVAGDAALGRRDRRLLLAAARRRRRTPR